MMTWLSWLFSPAAELRPADPREELRTLKDHRHALLESLNSHRAYGFDGLAEDDEAALKAVERRIFALQLKLGTSAGGALH